MKQIKVIIKLFTLCHIIDSSLALLILIKIIMMQKEELQKFPYKSKLIHLQLVEPLEKTASFYWKKPKTTAMTYLLKLSESILLNQIHFIKPPPINFSLQISESINGKYILIANKIQCTKGALKVITVGFLQCRYIKITIANSIELPPPSSIHCYGFNSDYIQGKHGYDTHEILFAKASKIIYD